MEHGNAAFIWDTKKDLLMFLKLKKKSQALVFHMFCLGRF